MSWRFCVAVAVASVAGSQLQSGQKIVEFRGIRCSERVGHYPVGSLGGLWSEALQEAAWLQCEEDAKCTGFMRYVGNDLLSCYNWCGRPQFCSTEGRPEANEQWVSFVKAEFLQEASMSALENPLMEQRHDRHWSIECPGRYYRAQIAVALLFPASDAKDVPENLCRVLVQPVGTPSVTSDTSAELSQLMFGRSLRLDGVLSQSEDSNLGFFSADPNPARPWRYFLDSHEYPTSSIGVPGVKRQVLSVYFLTNFSTCPGPHGSLLTVADALSERPGHVFVEDGIHENRKAAFEAYRITVMCGNFSVAPFPPLGIIYALAYASHPLVPEELHVQLSRVFFHLPDAVQPFTAVHLPSTHAFFEEMFQNPAKKNMVTFKQTFLFLSQQLFWYRYREPGLKRAEAAACALCDAQYRRSRRISAARDETIDSVDATRIAGVAVAVALCAMSRRGSHELRTAVRRTWARLVNRLEDTDLHFFVGKPGEPLADPLEEVTDVVELPVPENYKTINVKAFAMLEWTYERCPNLQWLIRLDDDVYLRPQPVLTQLHARPPVRYFWGNFDHGSNPVRDPIHQHYNSYDQMPEQRHPMWGDVFPPYARGHLWAMSIDLLGEIVGAWKHERRHHLKGMLDERIASKLPHPDDPALGVVIANIAKGGWSINLDDRDFNSFSLNPSCTSSFSNIHNRTWVVHHVSIETMHCMWALDEQSWGAHTLPASHEFPDLCKCSTEVEEEDDAADFDGHAFWYPRDRFNH